MDSFTGSFLHQYYQGGNRMIDKDTIKKGKELLGELEEPVTLVTFTQDIECELCHHNVELAKDMSKIDRKIGYELYDFEKDSDQRERYAIDKIPAIAVVSKEKDYGIRFYGIPSGYEFVSLIEAIRTISRNEHDLSSETLQRMQGVDKDVHIQVFVTPTCPYCPRAVILAHRLAFFSQRVRSDMVELMEFPHLANKYGVMGVPRSVINEDHYIEGAVPEKAFVDKILEALAA
jgi:glutaredoxin-like protein